MKTHDFYNLLEKNTKMVKLTKNSTAKYTDDLVAQYNACVDKLNKLSEDAVSAIQEMTELECRQIKGATREFKL